MYKAFLGQHWGWQGGTAVYGNSSWQDGRPSLTFTGGLKIGIPVAAAQCIGLIAGNTVARLQDLKALKVADPRR